MAVVTAIIEAPGDILYLKGRPLKDSKSPFRAPWEHQPLSKNGRW